MENVIEKHKFEIRRTSEYQGVFFSKEKLLKCSKLISFAGLEEVEYITQTGKQVKEFIFTKELSFQDILNFEEDIVIYKNPETGMKVLEFYDNYRE